MQDTPQPTDGSFLNGLKQGDEEAWRRYDQVYKPFLLAFIRRREIQQADANDIVQKVSEVVIRKIAVFERQRDGSFRKWLRSIVLKTVQNHRAREIPRQPLGGSDNLMMLAALADDGSELSQQFDREFQRRLFDTLLERVRPQFSERDWEVFLAKLQNELSTPQIAAKSGTTPANVHQIKSRIMKRLREEGRELLDDG